MATKDGKKTGGRQKGTPNSTTLDLFVKCQKYGVDCFEEMLIIAIKTESLLDRFRMFSEIAQYLYPKRKALEVTAEADINLANQAKQIAELSVEEQIKLLEQKLKELKGE